MKDARTAAHTHVIPETKAEARARREAITAEIARETGLDDAGLERLVRAFYEAAREDEVLGPKFAGVHDWDAHIAKIATFWSSVALMTGRYHGQPMPAHFPLNLQPDHFTRWLALFERTALSVCTPQGAAYLVEKAHRIARSLEMAMAFQRGEPPPRQAAAF